MHATTVAGSGGTGLVVSIPPTVPDPRRNEVIWEPRHHRGGGSPVRRSRATAVNSALPVWFIRMPSPYQLWRLQPEMGRVTCYHFKQRVARAPRALAGNVSTIPNQVIAAWRLYNAPASAV